jgi:hypothetical protein
MKLHTTNYIDTFIEVAEDCPVDIAEIPPMKAKEKTAANIQFEMLKKNPYKYTSDDVLFQVYVIKNEVPKAELKSARQKFFSKGQACFRSSPLTKRYGWGLHSDSNGRIAIYALGSAEYEKFLNDTTLKRIKAMRSKRK